MKHTSHACSELEYESLPPALRRKYFSSLERLRLAKDGVTISRTRSFGNSSRNSKHRKSISEVFSIPFQHQLKPGRNHLQRPSASNSLSVNTDNAAWFASLPPAVRRKQFSKEEQILFANERQSIILDAADELFHRRCLEESPIEPPSFAFTRPQTSYFPEHLDGTSFLDTSASDVGSDSEPEDTEYTAATEVMNQKGMANYSLDKFPWLDNESDLDLRLDDYHAAIAETTIRQAASDFRPTSRHTLSMSAPMLNRGPATSSQPNLAPSHRAAASSTQTRASLLSPLSPSRHRSKASISSIDHRATHYQDPAARMKLRVYLASPSKFDEALEFGFPSLQDTTQVSHDRERPRTGPRLTNDSGRTFYTEDAPSLLGDDGSSAGEVDAVLNPRTPDDAEFRLNRKSRKISNDQRLVKPQVLRHLTEPYAQSTTLDREMTIHMTLTRPDLRTPEALGSKVNSRPLEQSALPTPENRTSVWDTLPEDESKVRRLWRKLKMK